MGKENMAAKDKIDNLDKWIIPRPPSQIPSTLFNDSNPKVGGKGGAPPETPPQRETPPQIDKQVTERCSGCGRDDDFCRCGADGFWWGSF